MMKLNAFKILAVLLLSIAANISLAQQTVQDALTHKVMVNHGQGTIVAYVKPVKSFSLQSDRSYFWFANHEIRSTQGGYSGKLLNGNYLEYDHDKKPVESGELDKGLKSGVWRKWDGAGRLLNDYQWHEGRKNGVYHLFDSVGRVSETGKYRNDLLHGKQLTFAADSTKKVFYKNGQLKERKPFIPASITRFFKKIL